MIGLIAFPIGVGAAIYLEEYARDTFVTRTLRTNIANLAGVPSIIYGIFGLAIFVRALGLGRSPLAAALTLALLIMPIVIIATIEALRAVPDSQREGAYALGATRWQVVRGSVLPAAAPGIVTGIILAMARAIGEAAPIIVIGAAAFVTFLPTPLQEGFSDPADPGLPVGQPAAGGLPGHRRGDDPRDAVPDRRSSTAWRSSLRNRLVPEHPVVEESSVNASVTEAPPAGRRRRGAQSAHRAPIRIHTTLEPRCRTTPSVPPSARSPSSCGTCRCWYGALPGRPRRLDAASPGARSRR